MSNKDTVSTEQKALLNKYYFIVFFILIFILLGGISYVLFLSKQSILLVKADITPTPTLKILPTPTTEPVIIPSTGPSPTPIPKNNFIKDKQDPVSRDLINVAVYNGSGISGAASKLASYLKQLGYKVVTTANADEFTYEGIHITIKPTKKLFAQILEKDLEKKYIVSEIVEKNPTENIDAIVIIGK